VYGGTSLTNGIDCSGFTMRVHEHFGISIPRSSVAQANGGKPVPIGSVQPGDIIYYGNHVGIYIGNGQIVHASTAKTGIKISSYTYRTPICARRYW
jgi:cell wall-associated NlpC family hydrolase